MDCNCTDMQALNSPRWTCPLHGVITRATPVRDKQLAAFEETIEICQSIVQKHAANCEAWEAHGAEECVEALQAKLDALRYG